MFRYLRGHRIPMKDIIWLDECKSTNDEAARYLDDPTVKAVVAQTQTSGRGRLGRAWLSERDAGLYLSWITRPQFDSSLGSAIPLLAAVATGEVCWLYGVKVQLKWPNDVLFEKRKLAGILCEARGTPERWSAIVGIGLNLKRPANGCPKYIPANALDEISDGDINREDIAYALTERLDYWVKVVEKRGLEPVLSAWTQQGIPVGTPLVRDGVQGTFAGLDSDGALRMETTHGIETIYAGDVSLS